MRKAEYKQIDTQIIENAILVDDINELGEVIGQHEETVRKEVPVMGMVYRDMTEEEEAEFLAEQANIPPMPKSLEERMDEAEVIAEEAYLTAVYNSVLIETFMEV